MAIDKSILQKTVGHNMRKMRGERDFTQAALAEMVELSEGHIIQIEGGFKFPSVFALARIAEALDVSTEYLLFGESRNTTHENIGILLSSLNGGDLAKIEELLNLIKKNFLTEN